jgi:5'-AMP-activated protein kinase regulatory beta subunit
MSKTKPASRKTLFSCHAPEAQQVFLAGTFNEWKPDATPMDKGGDGKWIASLDLPAGRHEFKFVVDGEWCCEIDCDANSECPQCVPNDMGGMNRVYDVK